MSVPHFTVQMLTLGLKVSVSHFTVQGGRLLFILGLKLSVPHFTATRSTSPTKINRWSFNCHGSGRPGALLIIIAVALSAPLHCIALYCTACQSGQSSLALRFLMRNKLEKGLELLREVKEEK